MQAAAVHRKVVAGQERREGKARRVAAPEGLDQQAGHAAGPVGTGQIMGNIGIVGAQLPRGRIDPVALFGDGQRDDARAGCGEGREDPARFFGQDQALPEGSDDAVGLAFGPARDEGVEMVLRRQRIAHRGTAHRDGGDAPRPLARGEAIIGRDRLMGAVKGAEAQMHDPGPDGRAVVGRAGDVGRQILEARRAQGLRRSHSGPSLRHRGVASRPAASLERQGA